MKAAGLFFLTQRVTQVQLNSATDGLVRGWRFDLVERLENKRENRVAALWRGADADRTAIALWEHLKPGCALEIELENLRARDGVLHGRIVRCALAPARWPGRSPMAAAAIASAMTAVRADPSRQLPPGSIRPLP